MWSAELLANGGRAIMRSECTDCTAKVDCGQGTRRACERVHRAGRGTMHRGRIFSLAPIRPCLGSPALGCFPTACAGVPACAGSRNEPYLDVAADRARALLESRDGRGVLARDLQAGDGALGRAQTSRPLLGSINWASSRLTSCARKGTVKGQTEPHRPRGFVHDTPTGASCSEHEGRIRSSVEEADCAGVHAAEAVCWSCRGASRGGRMWGCYR
jgi:hypothetical protein